MNTLSEKLENLNKNRAGLMFAMGVLFIAIMLACIFVSANFGYFLLICLALAMGSATLLGRYWCNWMCPRGSFLEYFLKKVSLQKRFPSFFKKTSFLTFVVAVFMVMMGGNLYLLLQSYTLVPALGITLTRLLIVSTIVAIILGIVYEPRAWCVFCPGATFAKLSAAFRGKKPYLVNEASACTSCQLCVKSCPFEIDASQGGVIDEADCLKCFVCIEKCPTKALSFSDHK